MRWGIYTWYITVIESYNQDKTCIKWMHIYKEKRFTFYNYVCYPLHLHSYIITLTVLFIFFRINSRLFRQFTFYFLQTNYFIFSFQLWKAHEVTLESEEMITSCETQDFVPFGRMYLHRHPGQFQIQVLHSATIHSSAEQCFTKKKKNSMTAKQICLWIFITCCQ